MSERHEVTYFSGITGSVVRKGVREAVGEAAEVGGGGGGGGSGCGGVVCVPPRPT